MKRTFSIISLALVMTVVAFGQAPLTQKPTAEKLSKQQIFSLVSAAKTPAEHQRIAEYYKAKSKDYLAESKEHAQMTEQYKKNPLTSSEKYSRFTVDHCAYLAQSFQKDSAKMLELAQMHEQMAKDAEQK